MCRAVTSGERRFRRSACSTLLGHAGVWVADGVAQNQYRDLSCASSTWCALTASYVVIIPACAVAAVAGVCGVLTGLVTKGSVTALRVAALVAAIVSAVLCLSAFALLLSVSYVYVPHLQGQCLALSMAVCVLSVVTGIVACVAKPPASRFESL